MNILREVRVREYNWLLKGKLGYFTKNEIRTICPDVGEATINRVFEKLRNEGKIEAVGKGRNSKWRKL